VRSDDTGNAGVFEPLDRSRYLIVVHSPEAAQSASINKKVGHWLEHRGLTNMLLELAGGRLQSNAEALSDPVRGRPRCRVFF
jgi:hypothetical protein